MNRCLASLSGRTLLLSSLLMGLCCLSCNIVFAQGIARTFPATALRGTLQVTTPPDILINGQAERLAPGARIKGSNNLLVLSASLAGQSVLVNYLRDPMGQVREVWILTSQESQEKRSGMEVITNIVSGPAADKPKTDDGKAP